MRGVTALALLLCAASGGHAVQFRLYNEAVSSAVVLVNSDVKATVLLHANAAVAVPNPGDVEVSGRAALPLALSLRRGATLPATCICPS
jgi:hypothetical protein